MRGTVHAAIGASAPAGLVLTGNASIPQAVVMSAVSAGFALLPDIDSPNALASKALGQPVHKAARWLSLAVLESTALPRDASYVGWMRTKNRDPAHRTLTHTAVAALLTGLVVYLVALMGGAPTGMAAAFGVFLLWPVNRSVAWAAVLGAAVAAVGAVLLLSPWLLALAAGGGYLSHLLADACTTAGVPLAWPVPIKDKRWWNIRLLGNRITSGSGRESGPAVGVALASNVLLLFLML